MPHTGLEPVLIAEPHFECGASTNSANEAFLFVGVERFELPKSLKTNGLQPFPTHHRRRTPKILCQTRNVFFLVFCLQIYQDYFKHPSLIEKIFLFI